MDRLNQFQYLTGLKMFQEGTFFHQDKYNLWDYLNPSRDLSPFKIHDFRLSSWQADNQLLGKCLSHMQTLGYCGK